tara:strand:+ start:900 stop:1097 length:198 start_codon:yes stop_codon:yes gene_type:complete
MFMTATALRPLDTAPLAEYRVSCEIEAHDGMHQLCLLVMAMNEDDATDMALEMLDRGKITDVCCE